MEERGLKYDFLYDWVKPGNTLNKNILKKGDSTPIEDKKTKVFHPNMGNKMNDPHIYNQSIPPNHLNTNMIIDDRVNNYPNNKSTHQFKNENRGKNDKFI
jgi:hypothetical protein